MDKFRVRSYIQKAGLAELLPNLIAGGYRSTEDFRKDWDSFPNQFVIKCNHGCGYNILVTDKESENLDDVIQKLDIWMNEDFWKIYCEPQYKNVEKRIIVEEYLADDILTYCFNGKPEVVYVSSNGENGEKDLYIQS